MDLSLKIDEVTSIDPAVFSREYLATQKPLVIRGLGKRSPAGALWNLNYFKSTMGHVDIDLYDNKNVHSSASAYTRPDRKMKFGEYLDILNQNEPTSLRVFLFNLYKLNPKLRDEYPCPDLFKGTLDRVAHMFFASKGSSVRIHYDIDMSNVLHTHFGGRKRVLLIAPQYSKHLYCLPFNTYSLVDIDKPNYRKYPALHAVKAYEVILEHGDSLFMPSGYWHYITYLDTGFSVSYRKMAAGLGGKLRGAANLGLWMPLDKLFNALAGPGWLSTKQRMARKRAYHAIEREYKRSPSAFVRETQDITFV